MTKKIWCLFIAALLFSACSGGEDNGNPMEAMLAARPVDATETPTDDDVSSTEDDDVTEQSPLAVPQMGASDDDMMAPVATLEPEVTVSVAPTAEPTVEPGDEPESLPDGAGGEATVEEADEPEPTAPIGGEGGAGGNPVVEPESTPQPEPTVTVEPEPTVIVEPEPAVVVEPEPAAQPEPQPTVEPEPTVVVEPEPIVEPAPQPEPVAQPEPTVVVEPEPIAEPVPQPEPAPEPIVEPAPEPAPEPVAEPEPAPEPEAPVCTPTPKASASGSLTSMTCGTWEFKPFGTAYDISGDAICLAANDCYFALGLALNGYQLMHWNGTDVSAVALPTAVNVATVAGDSSELLVLGTTNGTPVAYRKVGAGTWTQVTGFTFQSGATITFTAAEKIGNTFFIGVGMGSVDPGPCQGMCPYMMVSQVYRLDTSLTLLDEIDQAGIEAFAGASETDVLIAGQFLNAEGLSSAPLLHRWNGCGMDSHSANLPSSMIDIMDIAVVEGETTIVGYLAGDGYTGTRAVSDDLVSWTTTDLPNRHAVFAYAAFGKGSGVLTGTFRQECTGCPTIPYIVEVSGDMQGQPVYINTGTNADEVTDGAFLGNTGLGVTPRGVTTSTCQ